MVGDAGEVAQGGMDVLGTDADAVLPVGRQGLRVERHVENARRVAEFLRSDPRVAWVNYAGFPDSPFHALVQQYLGGRACSLLTFGVKGGFAAGMKFYDALTLIKRF